MTKVRLSRLDNKQKRLQHPFSNFQAWKSCENEEFPQQKIQFLGKSISILGERGFWVSLATNVRALVCDIRCIVYCIKTIDLYFSFNLYAKKGCWTECMIFNKMHYPIWIFSFKTIPLNLMRQLITKTYAQT